MQFVYSSVVILGAVAILVAARLFLNFIGKTRHFTILQYCFWLAGEIVLIAFAYTIFNELILNDPRAFPEVLQRSFLFISLIMFIPYLVSYLYFALKDKDDKVRELLEQQEQLLLKQKLMQMAPPMQKDTAESMASELEPALETPAAPLTDWANEVIHFTDEKGSLKLSIKQDYVCYIVSADNYVNIFYQNKGKMAHCMVRTTMKNLEDMLEPRGFSRCHRSYLVNTKKVKIVRKERDGFYIDLDMDGIGDIPISKTYADKMLKAISLN
jgi:DNA-binding LytR/AlgR family response regulator